MKHLIITGIAALAVMLAGAPVASATPHPLSPSRGQGCSDLGKLAFDPAVGQIACNGFNWVASVEPTGIRNMGASCARSERDSVMASSADGYLIWCPSPKGVWEVYSE